MLIHTKENVQLEGHHLRHILITKLGRMHQQKLKPMRCSGKEKCLHGTAFSPLKCLWLKGKALHQGKLANNMLGDQDQNGKIKFTYQLMGCNVEQECYTSPAQDGQPESTQRETSDNPIKGNIRGLSSSEVKAIKTKGRLINHSTLKETGQTGH